MARRVLQWIWIRFLRFTGCIWWAKREFRRRGSVIVLMGHRVLNDRDYLRTNSLPAMSVRARTFERLVEHIAKSCEVVDLRTASPGTRSGRLRVAFTFDDGWEDNFETALPVAASRGIPLTIFICPGLMQRRAPFWPEQVVARYRALNPQASQAEMEALIENLKAYSPVEREKYLLSLADSAESSEADRTLSWEQVHRMERAGVRFGSHTYSHEILTTIGDAEVREEVRRSREEIERRLGGKCSIFAYPSGAWSPASRATLESEGYELAFTTERGAWTEDCDPLAIPRLNLSEDNLTEGNGSFSPTRFEYAIFWKAWRASQKKPRVTADRLTR